MIYVFCLYVCLYMYHFCAWCPWRPEEGDGSPETRDTVSGTWSSVRAAHMLNCVSLCAGGASETYPFNIFTALTFLRGLAYWYSWFFPQPHTSALHLWGGGVVGDGEWLPSLLDYRCFGNVPDTAELPISLWFAESHGSLLLLMVFIGTHLPCGKMSF